MIWIKSNIYCSMNAFVPIIDRVRVAMRIKQCTFSSKRLFRSIRFFYDVFLYLFLDFLPVLFFLQTSFWSHQIL